MNANILLILFPLIPLSCIIVSLLIKYVSTKDVSVNAIIVSSLFQLAVGILLILKFIDYEGLYTVVLSEWKHSIQLSFDSYRVFFLAAYLTPVLLTIFHHKKLHDFNIRILFLFYLSGCSGLIVAGDIFNFYIFYEVMIMAAYILIAVNRKYYASIKYMIFGAASSAVFLAGIILLYASGSYFSYSFIYNLDRYNATNVQFILLFFSVAFFIKGAFFPVSGWVATCHSATNSLISCFLSSFTIFSGIMGLFYFVVLPAEIVGNDTILKFIGFLSILTITIPSIVLLFEPDLKRCIAGSTVFTIGFIGLTIAGGAYKLALFYMAIHAVYKSYMFLLSDDFIVDKNRVFGNSISIILFMVSILLTVGFFPTLTYFIKYNTLESNFVYKLISYVSIFLVLGSFLKFTYIFKKISVQWSFYLIFPLMFASYYYLYPFSWKHSGLLLGVDYSILLLALFGAKFIYSKLEVLSCLDTKYLYININFELLYIVMLFIVQIMAMRILI